MQKGKKGIKMLKLFFNTHKYAFFRFFMEKIIKSI